MMKKIIIINNDMKVGGVQKSLYNLLWSIEGQYDITLCLFRRSGEYAKQLPPTVKVVEARGAYRLLGMSQGECKGIKVLQRGALAFASRVLGRKKVVSLIRHRQPQLEESYDCAISYLHNGRAKSFYGGVQDFVLDCVKAEKRVAFLHCDYRNCGADHPENNRDMERFDRIAACSDGCRAVFESVLPELKERCVTVRNCHRCEEIRAMAEDEPVVYESEAVNILMVSRLSHEKGIDRAIRAMAKAIQMGMRVRLHVVGGGVEEEKLRMLAETCGVSDWVEFCGEQSNPYRYMKNADLLLMTSYHEAAPMVIDEARSLGLPILTTETTSSRDMVTDMSSGWVCDNSQEAIDEALLRVVSDREGLVALKRDLLEKQTDNSIAIAQFAAMLEF